jgi:hypothetical protein
MVAVEQRSKSSPFTAVIAVIIMIITGMIY